MTDRLKIITLNQPGITDFSAVRNKLMTGKTAAWLLFLDSDEQLSAPLDPNKLDQRYNYAFKRDDWFLGRKLNFGETAAVRLVRLVQPGTGKWQGKVHEEFVSNLPVKLLPQRLLHRRKLTLTQFLDRLNFYSSLRAENLFEAGEKFSLFQLIFFPRAKFAQNYLFRLGFLDGLPGLAMAFFMSLHSLFVRIKLYEKTR